MPKQKCLRAGTILRVTEIQTVILASMAPSVVPPCSLLQRVSEEILWYPSLEIALLLYPSLPHPQGVFISKSPYYIPGRGMDVYWTRVPHFKSYMFPDLEIRIMRRRQISRMYLRNAEMLMH